MELLTNCLGKLFLQFIKYLHVEVEQRKCSLDKYKIQKYAMAH